MNNDKHYEGTSGVYKTIYANTEITVRLFESPELEVNTSVFQAVVTYKDSNQNTRQDLDTLTMEVRDHCRKEAVKMAKSKGENTFSYMHKAYMAECYWQLIK